MTSAEEKYNKNYAYEFIDREVKTPMTFRQVDNGDGTITLIAVPTQVISEGTPLNSNVFMGMQSDLLDLVYPIGRGFIDFTDTDYSNYLGFTWERELMGMFPLGADDTNIQIGDTGGSQTKSITIDNLPSHNHTFKGNASSHSHSTTMVQAKSDGISSADGVNRYDFTADTRTGATSITPSGTISNTGNNKPLDIMPPFKAVYYWKRVA